MDASTWFIAYWIVEKGGLVLEKKGTDWGNKRGILSQAWSKKSGFVEEAAQKDVH